MKIAVITCYYQPDYVRAVTIRQSIAHNTEHELITIKNKFKGLLRYPEVAGRIAWSRLSKRPDAYILTFRGYEILPLVNLVTWSKPLIYDEFLNPLEWLDEDRKQWWVSLVPKKFLKLFYKWLLRRPKIILTDTDAHANHSQKILGLKSDKFVSLPVGADESIFNLQQHYPTKDLFTVFYYGTMQPLHGLDIVLQAFESLKDLPVQLVFSGGDKETVTAVEASQSKGANIIHHKWIPYDKLPSFISRAQLCLGGPFGDTTQASMVVTGKTYQFLACGAAVLVGQTHAQTEFKDQVNCLKVPLGDPQALADKIRWAYSHHKQLNQIRSAGYKLYNNEFSAPALSTKMAKILERVS